VSGKDLFGLVIVVSGLFPSVGHAPLARSIPTKPERYDKLSVAVYTYRSLTICHCDAIHPGQKKEHGERARVESRDAGPADYLLNLDTTRQDRRTLRV
jgi:hypothetical protein